MGAEVTSERQPARELAAVPKTGRAATVKV